MSSQQNSAGKYRLIKMLQSQFTVLYSLFQSLLGFFFCGFQIPFLQFILKVWNFKTRYRVHLFLYNSKNSLDSTVYQTSEPKFERWQQLSVC